MESFSKKAEAKHDIIKEYTFEEVKWLDVNGKEQRTSRHTFENRVSEAKRDLDAEQSVPADPFFEANNWKHVSVLSEEEWADMRHSASKYGLEAAKSFIFERTHNKRNRK
jgi:hypothetical protein